MPRKVNTVPKKPPAHTAKSRRRSPYELVQELKAKRDKLQETLTNRINKIDQRINELEAKHQAKIQISQLMETKSAEELIKEEAELKSKLSLLKKARKLSQHK
ncbi:MAG: hypothetical protein HY692_00430 [Cyanobacteria bacterium NC_groundwater_1444_Ag_S-0.65um_54_12]|nr:hypothetical protein [Cyanobacteria bacterium NC_groundwater_1444_Ag_S-0.65um_54_12]